MNDFLRNTSIKTRFNILLALFFLGLVLISWMSYRNSVANLMTGKQESVRNVVSLVRSAVDFQQGLADKGVISEKEAKQRVLDLVAHLRYANNDYIWINDFDYQMLMHPFKPELNGTSMYDFKDAVGNYPFRDFVDVAKAGGGFSNYYWPKPGKDKPVRKISYLAAYQPWHWVIGSGLYVDDVEQEAAQQALQLAAIVGAIVVVLLILSVAITRSITRPLSAAVARMQDIAQGEGDLTAHMSLAGNDEISALSAEFNSFVDKIRALVVNVNRSVAQLTNSANELAAITDKSAAHAQQQKMETDQVASAMNEMSATAREIANIAEQASMCANSANDESTRSREIVTQTLKAVDALARQMDLTTESIGRLKDETQSIGGVITVIQGIAEQTNLLALNAAIEAARAGEQGRGFAVVADEVRALASKTQHSTKEINDMIAKLQQGATQAVDSMRNSLETTRVSVEHAHQAEQSLDEVMNGIVAINDRNAQVATASEEQSLVAEEINKNVTNIATLSEHNSASMKGVLNASRGVRDVAETLQRQLEHFRV